MGIKGNKPTKLLPKKSQKSQKSQKNHKK